MKLKFSECLNKCILRFDCDRSYCIFGDVEADRMMEEVKRKYLRHNA